MFSARITVFFAEMARRFAADPKGSISFVFGVALVPMVTAASIVIHYSEASYVRAQLDSLVDSAALAGINTQAVLKTVGTTDRTQAVTQLIRAEFQSQLDRKPRLKAMVKSTTIDTTISNNVMRTKLCYSAEVSTSFSNLLGLGTIQQSRCVQASTSLPEYVSIHALIDASGSMGIGASVTDQTLMLNKLGCAFACHTVDWAQPMYSPNCDTYNDFAHTTACAHKIGARTRFDVVRQTLVDMIDKASATQQFPEQFKFSVHKFSNWATQVHATSADLASVKKAVQAMQPDVVGAGTLIKYSLDQIRSKIPVGGDGTSPASPKVYLIILTDGVEDDLKEYCTVERGISACSFWGRWTRDANLTLNYPGFTYYLRTQVLDPAACTPFKQDRINMITLYTEYVRPPNSTHYHLNRVVSELGPYIKPSLQACASAADMAYSANTPAEIESAMNQIFRKIVVRPQLTN